MTKFTITRTSEWNNKGREIGVYLNDQKIAVIKEGEQKEIETKPGTYKINEKLIGVRVLCFNLS